MAVFDRIPSFWRRTSRLDRVALAIISLYLLSWLLRAGRIELPGSGFIGFLSFLAAAYFVFRLLAWARVRLLWSLRNRLVTAYVFIAVVPVLLLLLMAGLSAYIIYSQLGAYVLYGDLQKRIDKVSAAAEAVAASLPPTESGKGGVAQGPAPSLQAVSGLLEERRKDLPGLEVRLNEGLDILKQHGGPLGDRFAGLVQADEKAWLRAIVARRTTAGRIVVSAAVPIAPELLESLVPDLGPVQVTLMRRVAAGETKGLVIQIGDRRFVSIAQIATRNRALAPAANWLDYEVKGVSKLEAVLVGAQAEGQGATPVFISFSTRPSQLHRRLFTSFGELSEVAWWALVFVGVVFLIIEVGALITGVVLTRTITRTVGDLYRATEFVQQGDFSHRIRVRHRDQLGALGESFNAMTSSITNLMEEQRKRQRLENELSIAREVQAQLFPRALPTLPGVELAAVCRAARMVSGDYYDFIRLGPAQLAMAIADISGKGISAALLMASLQAALRSQVLLDGRVAQNTAELVARLNRHLFLNTSEDRYATFFFAIYDADTRILTYTNAGHLPPLYIVDDHVTKLEQGGMVVGLFDDCVYEQGTVHIEPGSLLVAYSDGLIEPENVYGEEFGSRRLIGEVLRQRHAPPQRAAEALVAAAEEWAGSPEQADDMTVIVARID